MPKSIWNFTMAQKIMALFVALIIMLIFTIFFKKESSVKNDHQENINFCSNYYKKVLKNLENDPLLKFLFERDRTFVLVYYISGFISVNDSEELIETNFETDPDYSKTIKAFFQVDLPEIGEGLKELVILAKKRNNSPEEKSKYLKQAKNLDLFILNNWDIIFYKLKLFIKDGEK